jgi:hypothetical protein
VTLPRAPARRGVEFATSREPPPAAHSGWQRSRHAIGCKISGRMRLRAEALRMTFRFPAVEPYESGMLDVGDGHRVYWECCGNPAGRPAVYLHGGPGSGSTPSARRYFDPDAYRVNRFASRARLRRALPRPRALAGGGPAISWCQRGGAWRCPRFPVPAAWATLVVGTFVRSGGC